VFRESGRNLQTGAGEDRTAFCFNTGIHKIYGIDDGITGVDLMDLSTREIRRVSADLLILESGRHPELVFVKTPDEIEAADRDEAETVSPAAPTSEGGGVEWEAVIPYKKPEFADSTGLFSPGDVFSDFSAAIKAIGAGRRAAASIHQLMNGMMPMLDNSVVTREQDVQNVDHVDHVRPGIRQIMPISDSAELSAGIELEKGYTEAEARAEADRCLQCGLVCYQQTGFEDTSQDGAAAAADGRHGRSAMA
jgi:hypothetical protein